MTQDANFMTLGKTFIAGGVAGCCAKTCVAPLDRVKILKQAHNIHYEGFGILRTHIHIVHLEGYLGLYKGNGTQMIRIFPYAAVQYLSYEYYSKVLKTLKLNKSLAQFISGSFAGFSAVAVTYPLDMIRARLAFQVKGHHKYTGILHAMSSIKSTEGGLWALYRGITPTIIGMAPYAGFSFYGFETSKAFLLRHWAHIFGTKSQGSHDKVTLIVPAKLLCGGFAGAFAQTIAYPLDVVRRKIQLSFLLPNPQDYHNGFLRTLKLVYMEDGIVRGLYRGLSLNYVRVIPMISISFCTFEVTKQILGLDTSVHH